MSFKGLSNSYLEKLGKKLLPKTFLGVYPSDIHPKSSKKDYSFIFNTGSSNTSGEHFVAVFKTYKKVFYFDSFGVKPNKKLIQRFLHRLKLPIISFKTPLQAEDSNFCGFYCLAFLLMKYNKIQTSAFVRLFSNTNLKQNDTVVIEFILDCI